MNVRCSAYEYFTKSVAGRNACLYFFGRSFSGDEVVRRIDAMAAFLHAKGIGKGDVVAIHLPNVPECIFTIYAVNKLGAIAFVTHPLLPAKALRDETEKAGAKLLVSALKTTEDIGVPRVVCDCVSFLPKIKRAIARLRLPAFPKGADKYPYEALSDGGIAAAGMAEDVAFYLPSGGTTGEPKIIRITNEAFNRNAEATLSLAKIDLSKGSILLALPLFHGFGLSSALHGVVSGGARGVIVPYFDSKRVARYLEKGEVEMILGVPNMFRKLLKEPVFRKNIGRMLLAFSGGDTLPEKVKREYDELARNAGSISRLYQGYGLAETVSVCVANSFGEDKIGTIGKPVNAEVAVFGEDGAVLPVGEIGEIGVKTGCMMKGYLGQEDRTDDYLRTGDLGCIDEEGYVHFSGRKKRIIVIGGMNVYPLEIERAAQELPFVTEAAAVEYRVDDKPLIALFISDDSEENEENKTRLVMDHLRGRVIRYALPTRVIFLPSLPRTPIGKIDVNSLAKGL